MLSKLKTIYSQLDALQLFSAATCAALVSFLVTSAAIDAGLSAVFAQLGGVVLWLALTATGCANIAKLRSAG